MTVWENFMKILETIRYASPEDEKEQSEELIVKKRDNDNDRSFCIGDSNWCVL